MSISSNGVNKEVEYVVINKSSLNLSDDSSGVDVSKLIKIFLGTLKVLVILGGIVWGTALLFAEKADEKDLEKVRDRIEFVEKNDVAQTVILENIKNTLKKLEDKLDKVLKK